MAKAKTITISILVILVLGFVATAVYFGFGLQSGVQVTSNNFVKPSWARLECAPTDTYEGKQNVNVPKSGISVYCGRDENTDACRVTITDIPSEWWSGAVKARYTTCNNDGTNCDSNERTLTIPDGVREHVIPTMLPKGKKFFIRFERTLFNINVEGNVIKEYKPWQLYRFVGGSKSIVRSNSCSVPGSAESKIPSDSVYPNPLTMNGGEGSKWVNYVDDWFYGPPTNVFNHPSQGEVYCTNGAIYDIVELEFKDGSLKKLEPTYSGTRADGQSLSGLGRKIQNVECCPNEPTCGSDFKFKEEDQGQSCFSDVQCPNAGQPIPKSSTSYVVWSCENNKCVESSPITTQCTTSSQCPSGQICDLSRTNYGVCIQQTGSDQCDDGICSVNENKNSCPADCTETANSCQEKASKYPWLGYEYKEVATEDCGFLCSIGIGDPKLTTESSCSPTFLKYYLIGGTILGLLIIGGIYASRRNPTRRKK